MVRITTIIDNSLHPTNSDLHAEHALSFMIEHDGECHIVDVGKSDKTVSNLQALNLNKTPKSIILSHHHNDHTGALKLFAKRYPSTKIYAHPLALDHQFISLKNPHTPQNISTDTATLHNNNNFIPTTVSQYITPQIALICDFAHNHTKPLANNHLHICDYNNNIVRDSFDHEIAVAIITSKGLVIISSCSHNGAQNIIDTCAKFTGKSPVAFIGGMHIVDSFETPTQIDNITRNIFTSYPDLTICTGHCTSKYVVKQMQTLYPTKVKHLHSGFVFEL